MDKIKVCSKQFMDEHGRERIFYGINMGGKNLPLMKSYRDTFSIELLKNHLNSLHNSGFNVIRFFMNWSYLEPEPYKYNEEAFNYIQEFMDLFA